MKRILLSFIVFTSLCSACQIKEVKPEENSFLTNQKVLILYLTRTNNTKAIAQMIHEEVGGDLVALELITPYPTDYKKHVDPVVQENETGFLPPLKTKIENIKQYDVVFIGFPTWGMKLPPPIKSLLKQYDLKGKKVIPFNTNAGYGIGSSFDMVNQLCVDCKIAEGFSVKGGIERDGILFVMEGKKEIQARTEVTAWLKKIKLLN